MTPETETQILLDTLKMLNIINEILEKQNQIIDLLQTNEYNNTTDSNTK